MVGVVAAAEPVAAAQGHRLAHGGCLLLLRRVATIQGMAASPAVAPIWRMEFGEGPLVASAIHDGHAVRPEVAALVKLTDAERLYEEDPYTGGWTTIAPTRVVGLRSRFEVDLNRPRQSAVYLRPEDAWGLDVWQSPPSADLIARSLAEYDAFYAELRFLLERLVKMHGRVVVFDLHSYNHCRGGRGCPPADPAENPEINLGTGSLDRARWAPIVGRVLTELSSFDYMGRKLDVRENVKFLGGELSKWVHREFPETVCALAIEVKKSFMDEWTGELDEMRFHAVHGALAQAAAGVLAELKC
jgi:N-formylglutamate amidohydrolase